VLALQVLHESDMTQYVKRPVMWDGRLPGEQFTSRAYKENVQSNGYAIAKITVERAVTAAAEVRRPAAGCERALLARREHCTAWCERVGRCRLSLAPPAGPRPAVGCGTP
jgi:hypothetical protein